MGDIRADRLDRLPIIRFLVLGFLFLGRFLVLGLFLRDGILSRRRRWCRLGATGDDQSHYDKKW
jgi:hypothetical protein